MRFGRIPLALLGTLWLAAPPALAAATDLQKFEKKVARTAQPIDAPDLTKARGLCACVSADAAVQNRAGVLVYTVEAGMVASFVKVSCAAPVFDPVTGTHGVDLICESWTLLGR